MSKMEDYYDKLLTRKELAERWQVTPKAIDDWRRDGIITKCKGIPAIRFSEQYIQELEGVKPEKFSPLERKKLERKLEEVTKERDELRDILNELDFVMAKARYNQRK